ncbi:MAG: ImmA/IrrE family metallo-endopeptidase [Clostridia bacterium]
MGNKNYAYINCEMLKWARERTPIKIEEIPLRMKEFSNEQIENWENGTEYPSVNQAKKLCNLYDIPFAALYLSKLPNVDNTTYIDRRTYMDNLKGDISYELWKEINRLKSCRECAIELLNLEEYRNVFKDINPNFSTNDISTKIREIFNIETPFKNKTAYSNNAFNYFRNKIESKGVMVLQIENISIKEIRGISLNYEILPIIAVNKNDSDRAKVFTLFHEIAHLVRRTSNLCLIDFNEREDEEEKICNNLAANILIPEITLDSIINGKDLSDDRVITNLSDRYAVSKFVIIKRLYDLNKIDFVLYKSKYEKYLDIFNEIKKIKKKQGQKIIVTQDKKLISSSGKLYPKIILNAYYEGKISFGEVCNTLNVNSRYIDNIERMVMFSE